MIIRAIGVLEGIALVGDPDFAIIDEAYPYLSKQLLTNPSDRLRASLRPWQTARFPLSPPRNGIRSPFQRIFSCFIPFEKW